ncbi:uncharacterized protein LOC116849658 isoform X2 [Odontomachus brunneus]|uniref:uncharacterized protein LOC116849658 isoform X2 n=1 Tax=Odontomachus brunneus TaxID=486640 RepID=UPI0013F28244|nr:uncharacterized protein LOC116849658 isoform X2 [Odontomachus brunneus]
MDQVPTKWGSGLKANEGNVSATELSRTLRSRGRPWHFRSIRIHTQHVGSVLLLLLLLLFLSSTSSSSTVAHYEQFLYRVARLSLFPGGDKPRTGLVVHVIKGATTRTTDIDTMTPRGAVYLLLTILMLEGSQCSTRYFMQVRTNASEMFKTKADNLRILQDPIAITPNPLYDNMQSEHQNEDERMMKGISSDQYHRRNSFVETSTFNPDVLNKFLEDYANKIRSTTEKDFKYPYRIPKPTTESLVLEVDDETTEATTNHEQDEKLDQSTNDTSIEDALTELNDTLKRNKYYGTNTYEDRNGWVTLEAIPWSKSKISKWQANPSTQRPWPEIKPAWDKPSMKPWASDYSIRPTYENNKPYDKPKPNWSDNNEKPWQKPVSRPPYHPDDASSSTQAQKWPPENRPWNKHDPHRPSDIITDDRPANFPSTWSRPQTSKPSYQFADKFSEKVQSENNNDWPSRFDQDRLRPTLITERPNFSHYQYVNNHPPSHPASGDGQWVLLSTNRGYAKSRQRSIKIDTISPEMFKKINTTMSHRNRDKEESDSAIPVMTSKRQVRLTVLPSINGTNTTTSHGGLLEVEKSFKSVEQSRKEYEMQKLTTEANTLKKRPIRNTLSGQSSSSAVLAAVGAGMLPATMAMMIPMMLGRRKRDVALTERSLRKSNDLEVDLHKLATEYNAQQRRPMRL